MNGFFKPLRRKIGLATLVVACVFVAGWVRSCFTVDGIRIAIGDHVKVTLSSANGSLVCMSQKFDYPRTTSQLVEWGSGPISPEVIKLGTDNDTSDEEWSFRWLGFVISESAHSDFLFQKLGIVILPYWFFAIPTAALSAYLLLSKPRKKHPTNRQCDHA